MGLRTVIMDMRVIQTVKSVWTMIAELTLNRVKINLDYDRKVDLEKCQDQPFL